MEALTRAMYGDETRVGDLYRGYTNPFGKQASSSYRWTQLNAEILTQVLALLGGQRIRFIVEVGSFAGGLAMVLGRFAAALPTSPPVLCIDTWLGDLNMALGKLERRVIDKRHGDPTMYHQFLVNIIAANLTRHVVRRWESNLRLYYCPLLRHVRIPCSQLPMRAPSFLGAAMLAHLGLAADLLYLDSAHELRETFFELTLYWAALAPGGVLMGDDLNWRAVNRDVKLFARVYGQKLRLFDGCHALRSFRHADGNGYRTCVWYMQKAPDGGAAAAQGALLQPMTKSRPPTPKPTPKPTTQPRTSSSSVMRHATVASRLPSTLHHHLDHTGSVSQHPPPQRVPPPHG
jgi:hypothetical protein